MSGNLFLDWLTLTVSLYNTLVLLWLGVIVLLTAERRHWGIWLAGGGLLTAAAFFLSHSAILGIGLLHDPAIDFWWRIGWIPVILSPYAWYVVMLWYAGFWEEPPGAARPALSSNPIARRHQPWVWLLGLATLGLVALFAFANPLPSFRQVVQYDLRAAPSLAGAPALIFLYPVFIVACIGLSLDALLHPGPTQRMMGAAARQRARPWLALASAALLVVSLLVGALMWFAATAGPDALRRLTVARVILVDVVIDLLIAAAISLTGQAIVAYEIFTGKSLPRDGLQRAWRRMLVLAGGLGAAAGLSLVLGLPAIYTLLVSVALAALFYALLVWRSYTERERFIGQLRPFAAGLQSYRRLAAEPEALESGHGAPAGEPASNALFAAVCTQVLGARWGALVARGPLAELFGAPWVYPPGETRLPENLEALAEQVQVSPQALCVALEAAQGAPHPGGAWAVPLWNEQGCCGVLLLGEKSSGVYHQEEIETARAICERLVEARAGEEAARRLLGLQRRQLAESQALDRRARRALHDDILPQIHAALLAVSAAAAHPDGPEQAEAHREASTLLTGAHRRIADLLRDSPEALTPETARRGLVEALRRVVEQELRGAFERVDWSIDPQAQVAAAQLPPLAAEALFYAAREAIRNAARHARPADAGSGPALAIRIGAGDGIEVCIEDNGVGFGEGKRDRGGSGQGMLLHATLLALAGGILKLEETPTTAARVRLWLPVPGSRERSA